MKHIFFIIALIATPLTNASMLIDNEKSLQETISAINKDSQIIFSANAEIKLSHPLIYNGNYALTLIGNGTTIDGSAVTEKGTLIFNTTADISIQNLSVKNSAAKGILIKIPENSLQHDIKINLSKVNIINSAFHGLHIKDSKKSTTGIHLTITQSTFLKNGTKGIDFDGVRVDERNLGDITTLIKNSRFDNNGGDGLELDERGNGNVDAVIQQTTMNDNGYFTKDDPEDGFDVDEADAGNIKIRLNHFQAKKNKAEGLDFDEAGSGDIELILNHVNVKKNKSKGIKASEKNAGDFYASLNKVKAVKNKDDGIQFTETDQGKITLLLERVTAHKNDRYGIKVEQWLNKDNKDEKNKEEPGKILAKKVSLKKNGKGEKRIKTHNVIINNN